MNKVKKVNIILTILWAWLVAMLILVAIVNGKLGTEVICVAMVGVAMAILNWIPFRIQAKFPGIFWLEERLWKSESMVNLYEAVFGKGAVDVWHTEYVQVASQRQKKEAG